MTTSKSDYILCYQKLQSLSKNVNLELKAPKQNRRLSPGLRGLWTYAQYIGGSYLASVLVEVQAARKLAVMHSFIVAALNSKAAK